MDPSNYFSYNTSFNPVNQIPADGSSLNPAINKKQVAGLAEPVDDHGGRSPYLDLSRDFSTRVFDQVGEARNLQHGP